MLIEWPLNDFNDFLKDMISGMTWVEINEYIDNLNKKLLMLMILVKVLHSALQALQTMINFKQWAIMTFQRERSKEITGVFLYIQPGILKELYEAQYFILSGQKNVFIGWRGRL